MSASADRTADVVLSADELSVGYDGRTVVGGIGIEVRAGEVLALVGTNGSGKSTLLRSIVGLLPTISGSLRVLGASPQAVRSQVAYLSQFHPQAFVLPLRARDLVRMGRFADHGLLGRLGPADEDLVDRALERMDMVGSARRPVRDLSGGQRQRVYLAQVLARAARLLVLDEPAAGLDAAGQARYVQALAEERGRGAAVVVATHDIAEAARADQVLLLAGRVVASGPPARVLTTENLLETFGVGIREVGGAGLLVTEHPHGHDHEPGHEH